MHKVHCEKCPQAFKPSLTHRKQWGLNVYYVICPHCKHEILSFAESQETFERKKELAKVKRQYIKTRAKKHEIRFYQLQEQIRREVKEATEKVKEIIKGDDA